MTRVRALVVTNRYPPHHIGGYEILCRAFVEHARRSGWDVRVLTSDALIEGRSGRESDVFRELLLGATAGHRRPLSTRRRTRANRAILQRHLADFAPDLVCWWKLSGLPSSFLVDVAGTYPALGVACDDWLLTLPTRANIARSLVAPLVGLPGSVDLDDVANWAFISETVRDNATRAGAVRDGTVVPAGVDPERFPMRAAQPPWRGRLLFVGRLDERKGLPVVLEALTLLPADTTLTICTADPAAQSLHVPDRVDIHIGLGHDEIAAHYAAADALIFPSRWREPWGLVPLEAMASGVPVVATAVGGAGEYLRDEDNALVVAVDDPAGIAAAVERLAASPELRDRLVAGGAATAAALTERSFAERLLELATATARAGP